jgi:hypothetical protein
LAFGDCEAEAVQPLRARIATRAYETKRRILQDLSTDMTVISGDGVDLQVTRALGRQVWGKAATGVRIPSDPLADR